MSLSDWIISISAGTIATVLVVTGFFAQKWIQSVDEAVKDNAKLLAKLSDKFYALKVAYGIDSKSLTKTVEDEHFVTRNRTLGKLEKIEQDVACMQEQIKKEVMPALKNANEKIGHVLILEDRTLSQEKNMVKLFEAIQKLASRLQK